MFLDAFYHDLLGNLDGHTKIDVDEYINVCKKSMSSFD